MVQYRVLRLICLVISIAVTSPVPLGDDALKKIIRNGSSEESVINMPTFEDSNGRQLKQISLNSLIGNLQNNLFDAALSLNNASTNKYFNVLRIKTDTNPEHDVTERQLLTIEKKNSGVTAKLTTTTDSETMLPVTNKVIFEATERTSELDSMPAQIIIDRFDIQNHTAGLESIPKNNEDANSDHNITMPTSLTITPSNHVNSSSTEKSSTSGATSSTTLISATTPENIDHLKEAEAELKEKFAEIEAEPIILSARI